MAQVWVGKGDKGVRAKISMGDEGWNGGRGGGEG